MNIDSSIDKHVLRIDDISSQILSALSSAGNRIVAAISKSLGFSQSELSERTRKLEDLGYVMVIQRHKNLAMRSVALTAKGALRLLAFKDFHSVEKLERVLQIKRRLDSPLLETLRAMNWLTASGKAESLLVGMVRSLLNSGLSLESVSEDSLNFQLLEIFGYAIAISDQIEQMRAFIQQQKSIFPAIGIAMFMAANMKNREEVGKGSEEVDGQTHFYRRWILRNTAQYHELYHKLSILGHQFEILSMTQGERAEDGVLKTINLWNPNESFAYIKRWNVALSSSTVWARLALSFLSLMQILQPTHSEQKGKIKRPETFIKQVISNIITNPSAANYLTEFVKLFNIQCLALSDEGICAETKVACQSHQTPLMCRMVQQRIAEIKTDLENELSKHLKANPVFPIHGTIMAFDKKTQRTFPTYTYTSLLPIGR